MALTKPIIGDVAAFDATVGTTITFSATATEGSQITGNTIKIVTNDPSETTVYTDTVTSYELSHVIPPNTSSGLSNGNYYKVAIQTRDAIGNTSVWSDYVPFHCYSTPNLILNVSEILYSKSTLGKPLSCSHLAIVDLETYSFFAISSCVKLLLILIFLIFSLNFIVIT